MPVTVFHPTELVSVEKALLIPVATMAPALRNSCNDTTTKPRKAAGTISDWYVLGKKLVTRSAFISLLTQSSLRDINLDETDRNVDNNTADDKLSIMTSARSSPGSSNLD